MRRNPWAGPTRDIGISAVLDQRSASCLVNFDLKFGVVAGCCWYCNLLQPLQLCGTTAAVSNLERKKAKRMQKLQGQKAFFANLALQDDRNLWNLWWPKMTDSTRLERPTKPSMPSRKPLMKLPQLWRGRRRDYGTAILSFCSSPLFILLDDLIIFDLDPGCWPRWEAKAKEGELSQVEPVIFGLPVTFACFRCLAIFNHIQSTQNSTTACQSHDVHIIYQSV